MGIVKTIKDVDEGAWLEFKSIAVKSKMKMGDLFEDMVEDYRKKTEEFWNDILEGPPILSEEEAKSMDETVKRVRKEHGFRKKKWH